MRRSIVCKRVLLVILLLLAGCSSQQPLPTSSSPTRTPVVVIVTNEPAIALTSSNVNAQSLTDLPSTMTPTLRASLTQPVATACAPVVPDGWQEYVLQRGDTLYELAQAFNTSTEELITVNCIENEDAIRAGDVLSVPPFGFTGTMRLRVQPVLAADGGFVLPSQTVTLSLQNAPAGTAYVDFSYLPRSGDNAGVFQLITSDVNLRDGIGTPFAVPDNFYGELVATARNSSGGLLMEERIGPIGLDGVPVPVVQPLSLDVQPARAEGEIFYINAPEVELVISNVPDDAAAVQLGTYDNTNTFSPITTVSGDYRFLLAADAIPLEAVAARALDANNAVLTESPRYILIADAPQPQATSLTILGARYDPLTDTYFLPDDFVILSILSPPTHAARVAFFSGDGQALTTDDDPSDGFSGVFRWQEARGTSVYAQVYDAANTLILTTDRLSVVFTGG